MLDTSINIRLSKLASKEKKRIWRAHKVFVISLETTIFIYTNQLVMSFNNVEHFWNFIQDEEFTDKIFELKQSIWDKWVEKHLGKPDNSNGLDELADAYVSVYNQLNDAIFFELVDGVRREYMLEKFKQLQQRYDFEDKLTHIQEEWRNADILGNKEKVEYWKQQYNELIKK